MTTGSGISLRAFAKRLSVSPEAVSKAIKRGRLVRSVAVVNGRPVIADPALAAEEWATRAARLARTTRRASTPTHGTSVPADAPESLADVQRLIAIQRERRLRGDNDVREGRLVPVEDVERAHAAIVVAAKAQLLAVPHQAVLAGLPREHAPLVRRLIADALRELSEVQTLRELEAVEPGGAAA